MSVKLQPKMKKVYLYDEDGMGGEVPTNLIEYISWLQELLESVPENLKAYVIIENEENCDDKYIVIYYFRPETERELEQRQLQHDQDQEKIRTYELEKLAELKAKYE